MRNAKKLRKAGEVYIDPDFPPNVTSIGVLKHIKSKEVQIQISEVPWLRPKQFIRPHYSRGDCVDEWKVWDDPQPFHVTQGAVGNCGLIATLMAVAWKKGLVEQIIPKRDYTMDCGIVQVRLLVNGEWKVIKTDFHIPQIDGRELFTVMTKRQCWVAFLEKAFAKVKGSYGQLHVANTTANVFTFLTGCSTRTNRINSENNCDGLWEDLIKHNSSGYLLAAATPKIGEGSEEEKKYKEVNIETHHQYAILGFKKHDGHRLLRLGHGNRMRYTGKWSHLHAYENEFLEDLCPLDQEMSDWRIFWMEIDEFRRFFTYYYVGEYHEGSTALKFKETVRRKQRDDMQMLRLEIQKPDVILKYGEAEEIEQDQVVVYKWRGKYNCIFMVDNLRESEYVYVKCKIRSGNENEFWMCLSFDKIYWHPVPPKSRSIVGVVASNEYEPITVSVDVQYSVSYHFKWINDLDAWIDRNQLENFTPLESGN
ncbi:unnamed protein product [Caenorhabditis brenneri]